MSSAQVTSSWETDDMTLLSTLLLLQRVLKSFTIMEMKQDQRHQNRQENWIRRRSRLGRDIKITLSLIISEKEVFKQRWNGQLTLSWKPLAYQQQLSTTRSFFWKETKKVDIFSIMLILRPHWSRLHVFCQQMTEFRILEFNQKEKTIILPTILNIEVIRREST